ncbi:MAG: flavodoxin [Bacteroidales bacterium]|nr:flavodoxin [Bacteroidales bacterium]
MKQSVKPLLTVLLAVLTAGTACGQNKDNMNQKALVIFFSHAGENYSVGNIEVGNTKIVADYISEITGADQFEIVAEKNYDMPYMDLIKVAQDEAKAGELPAYKGDVDVAPYDVIFIGGPVWWGTYPQVMFTFFKDHDLSGKTVIPFTTHEGSGLASTVRDVKKAWPTATVKDGFSIYGHEVRTGRTKVEKWLKGSGLR